MRPASAAAVVLTVLVAGSRAAPQPQFGGLKKLISSFSGDEEAGGGERWRLPVSALRDHSDLRCKSQDI